jgi:uncharacterized protein YcfJ
MKRIPVLLACTLFLPTVPALAVDGQAVLGGALGGGLGAAVGSELGGRNGAIAGGAIGAAVGVAVSTDHDGHAAEQRVIYVEEEHHHHHPRGNAWGYYDRHRRHGD